MVGNKGQSSCVILWIFFLVIGIVPGVVSNVALTSIPFTTQPICPGETIEFTCIIESSILSWTSDDYIGVGSQFEFRSIDSIGTIKTSRLNGDTTANLTAIDGEILTSTLSIVARPTIRNSTITCNNIGLGTTNTSTVQVAAVPGAPRNVMAVGSMEDCMIQVTWEPPADTGGSNNTYRIDVPSRNITANINSSTEITLRVPNCADDIRIQVRAVNQFGCMESSETQLRLESGSSTSGLSSGAVAGISIAIAIACVIIAFIVVTVVISCYKWKVDEDKFISHLGLLCDTLKQNIRLSMQEAVRELLDLMSKKKMSYKFVTIKVNVKKALKKVLETRVTSARDVGFAVRRLKTMIPEVMSIFDAELKIVASYITMEKLSALIDEDDHKPYCDELIRLVNQASPKKVKNLLQKFFEALRDYEVHEAEKELQKAFETLGETFVDCTLQTQRIKEILEDANRKLLQDYEEADEVQKAFGELGKTYENCTLQPQIIKEILEDANRKLLQDDSSNSKGKKVSREESIRRMSVVERIKRRRTSGDHEVRSDDNADGQFPQIPKEVAPKPPVTEDAPGLSKDTSDPLGGHRQQQVSRTASMKAAVSRVLSFGRRGSEQVPRKSKSVEALTRVGYDGIREAEKPISDGGDTDVTSV